jgi:hypothetical protein
MPTGARIGPPNPLPVWADPLNQGQFKVELAPDGSLRIMDTSGRLRASLSWIHFQQWTRRYANLGLGNGGGTA